MALLARRPRVLLALLVGLLALAAALSCAHAARLPAAFRKEEDDAAAAHAPAPAAGVSVTEPLVVRAVNDDQQDEEVMRLSFGGGGSRSGGSSGGGSRSGGGGRGGSRSGGGGSRGGGSRSGGGSRGGSFRSQSTKYYDDGGGFDYDYSAAGGRGGVWKAGVSATVLAAVWLLNL